MLVGFHLINTYISSEQEIKKQYNHFFEMYSSRKFLAILIFLIQYLIDASIVDEKFPTVVPSKQVKICYVTKEIP